MNIIETCRRIVERGAKPQLPEVRPIIAAWYARPENGAGGELHSVLDDCNMENRVIVGHVTDPRVSDEAKWICNVLLMLSRSQRRRL